MPKSNNPPNRKMKADALSAKIERPSRQPIAGSSQPFYTNPTIPVGQGCSRMATSKLDTIGAQTLMEEILDPLQWLVDGLLLSGTIAILASRPKMGKSWLCLQLGLAVTMGQQFLNRTTAQADVLYLCLEDNYHRLQNRLWAIDDEASDGFRLATAAATLGTGLLSQIEMHLKENPATKLVIVDTLQIVRDSDSDYSYAADYNDMREFKQFADEHDICILLVHHLRKSEDVDDSFADISGTTGISGAVDTALVLKRRNRDASEGKLHITGRDVKYSTLVIELEDNGWVFVDELDDEERSAQFVPDCIIQIAHHFSRVEKSWLGSSSDLIEYLQLDVPNPAVLGKFLSQHRNYLSEQGIDYATERRKDARLIRLNFVG